MSNKSQSKRLHWVDILKGILILLLLLHHFPQAARQSEITPSDFKFVYCWQDIYVCFFMQAFFFVSGYCSSFSLPLKEFGIKLVKQLIIPFVFFEVLFCTVSCWLNSNISLNSIFDYWYNDNGSHLWFLNALIFSKLSIYLITRYISKSFFFLYFISITLFLVGIILNDLDYGRNFLYIRQSFTSIFFVVLGYHMKTAPNIFKSVLRLGYLFPLILCVMYIMHLPIPILTAAIGFGIKGVPVFFILSTSGVMAIILLCKKIGSNRAIEFFGKNSLIVYCTHFIPLVLITKILYTNIETHSTFSHILFVIVVYVLEVAVLYLFILLFSKTPFKYIVGHY